MQLILIRHGIAEDAGPGQPDETRHLTGVGQKRLRDAVPGLLRHLAGNSPIELWSSPLCRAAETADILAQGLRIESVRQIAALADGNLTAFLQQAAHRPSQATLIAVGHQPTLSNWAQTLCGVWLPFKKGAAAAIDMLSFQPPEGELVWFAQPKALRRLA